MEQCKGNINNFCYVCGRFTPIGPGNKHVPMSKDFIRAYEAYYTQQVLNVPWAPKSVCKRCYNSVLDWKSKRITSLPYGIPTLWFDPGIHNAENCYICINSKIGTNKKKSKNKDLIAVPSVQLPLPHSEAVPVPETFPSPDLLSTITGATAYTEITNDQSEFSEYIPEPLPSSDPILLNQDKLDYIVAKLELSKEKSEVLARFLKENNLLARGTKTTVYRNRNDTFKQLFTVNEEKTFTYCSDVQKLVETMGIKYKKDDWRLFIDSSKRSLKAVLLHKLNTKPSIPIAYSTDTKETYAKMKHILEKVRYDDHKWRICCDLKVVAMLSGMQGGYTKYMCFLCDWDSRFKGDQYGKNDWKDRKDSADSDIKM